MDRLEAMSVIVAVTETGSFSAASRRLKTPVATVSRKVAELEARLQAQLFQRSSRQMMLTDAGRSYIEACKRIIEQVDDAERAVSGEYRIPKGDLAVTAPWGLGHMHLVPIVVEFLDAYPEITLRLVLTDRVVNTVEENIDVSIRIGALPDSSMIASRIGSVRMVLCASPAYLAARGLPKEPADLRDHDCISVDSSAAQRAWKFAKGNREIAAPIRSRLTVNDPRPPSTRPSPAPGSPGSCRTRWRPRGVPARSLSCWKISSWSRCRFISCMPSESRCHLSSAPFSIG